MNRAISVLSLLFVIFCSTSLMFAQETSGSLEFTTKDATGAVVPGVSITVTSTGSTAGFNRTVTTNDQGYVQIPQMAPGTYIVETAPILGFGLTRNEVRVELGKATQVPLNLTATGASATVDVVGGGDAVIDTGGSEISRSVSAAKIELLPKGENFTTILKAIPGVSSYPGGFSIDGASSAENTFVIDGQEVTNYRNAGLNSNNNVPFSIVQEVQVKTSGFNAEFGGATGGVINVVTKGGNNDFHGDLGTQFEPSKLRGGNRPGLLRFTSGAIGTPTYLATNEYFTSPKTPFLSSFPSLNVSGPIVRDKVWFFTSYSPQITTSTVNTVFYNSAPAAQRTVQDTQTYTAESINEYAFARVDASPWSRLRLTGTFLWNPLIQNGILPFGAVSFGGVNPCATFAGTGTQCGNDLMSRRGGRQSSNNATFQAVYTPANWIVTSFRYSRGFLNEKLGNYNIPVVAGTRYLCWTGNTASTNFGPNACTQGQNDPANDISVKDVSIRENYEGDVAFLFSGGGRHDLKAGYQHQSIFNDLQKNSTVRIYLQYGSAINNNFNWSHGASPSAPICAPGQTTGCVLGHGTLYRYGEQGSGSNLNQAIYIQDKWQVGRLTMNLGVRVEKEALPSFNEFPAPFSFGWGDKIAPRLGAAFDLTGDGKTKIFGSYGKFYDRLKFKLAQGSFGGNFYRTDFFEILPNSGPFRTAFTPETILGNFSDAGGGNCPVSGFIGSGLSRCQNDYRVASNLPNLDVTEAGGIDANLRPFQQREFTFGFEREMNRNFVLRTRFTNKKLIDTVEDAGAISVNGSEIYITGNPGRGLHREFLELFGYDEPYATARRDYNAFEVILDRRFANNYFYNVSYTYSRLRGNYSGLANSDEGARSDPGVNRNFDLPLIGFTAKGESDYGPLATDRPHILNAYGGYVWDWAGSANSTEISAFQTFQSGTPQSTLVSFIVPMFLNGRGDMGRTPMFTQTDFNVTHRYRFGRDDRFAVAVNLNIINLWDQATVTSYQNTLSNFAVFSPPGLTTGGRYGCPNVVDASGPHVNYPCIINAFNRGDLYSAINANIENYQVAPHPALGHGRNSSYGMDNGYQGPRTVRFGFKFTF